MADKTSSSPVVVASSGGTTALPVRTQKKATISKSTKSRVKPAHPTTSEMVNAAIEKLQERGGSSLQAIKKYMAGTYKVDTEKQAIFIRKYLKAAVTSGVLVQTKGKGAVGSFKLASTKVATPKPKAKSAAKTKAPKKTPTAKKATTTKKAAPGTAQKTATKKAATAVVMQKKKVSKSPAAKPPKAKTSKAKSAPTAPVKKSRATVVKITKPVTAKPKKAAPKKPAAAKK